jgi:hypothetical protein
MRLITVEYTTGKALVCRVEDYVAADIYNKMALGTAKWLTFVGYTSATGPWDIHINLKHVVAVYSE